VLLEGDALQQVIAAATEQLKARKQKSFEESELTANWHGSPKKTQITCRCAAYSHYKQLMNDMRFTSHRLIRFTVR